MDGARSGVVYRQAGVILNVSYHSLSPRPKTLRHHDQQQSSCVQPIRILLCPLACPALQAFQLPSWEVFEAALLDPTTFAQIQAALKAQGLGSVLELSPFHSLALLTNIIDGWDCPNHLPERALMLLAFQVRGAADRACTPLVSVTTCGLLIVRARPWFRLPLVGC